MKHPLRNTVLSIAGSLAIAALFLASASSARAAGPGELRLASVAERMADTAHPGNKKGGEVSPPLRFGL